MKVAMDAEVRYVAEGGGVVVNGVLNGEEVGTEEIAGIEYKHGAGGFVVQNLTAPLHVDCSTGVAG